MGGDSNGLFASIGAKGLFFGNSGQVFKQLTGVIATIIYAGVITYILLKILDATMGLRVSEEEEIEGLDYSQHGESGYN